MPWRNSLLEFIAALRTAGMRISVAESIDAMHAVMAAGLEERGRLREALAATLLKDEGERILFENAFARFFGGGPGPRWEGRGRPPSRSGLSGIGGASGGTETARPGREVPVPPSGATAAQRDAEKSEQESGARLERDPDSAGDEAAANKDGGHDVPSTALAESTSAALAGLLSVLGEPQSRAGGHEPPGGVAGGRAALAREVEQLPFTSYGDLEYRQARDTLAILQRRLRTRLARRLRIARLDASICAARPALPSSVAAS